MCYNTYMKIEKLPDYAKPYKTKGYDVRLQHGVYMLFKISSKRVKDKNYPVLIQEFIGIIDKEKGLILKKKYPDTQIEYVEYGLSNFIYKRLFRTLLRSLFNATKEKNEIDILLGINKYVFGDINIASLSKCFLTQNKVEELLSRYDKIQPAKVERLVTKIKQEMQVLFGEDLLEFELLMKYVVVSANKDYTNPYYGERIMEIAKKHKVRII